MSIVLASILDADWLNLRQEIEAADQAGVAGFSLDIMDGSFAPRITFGPQNVAMIRNWTDLPLEVHLMVANPEETIPTFCDTGADQILFHIEAAEDPLVLAKYVKARGLLVGIAVELDTDLGTLNDDLLGAVDTVNLMAVPVGFGGANSSSETVARVSELRERLDSLGLRVALEADGGVKPADTGSLSAAGVDFLVIGTGIYHSESYVDAVAQARAGIRPDQESDSRVAQFLSRPARAHEGDSSRRLRLEELRQSLDIPKRSWDPLTSIR